MSTINKIIERIPLFAGMSINSRESKDGEAAIIVSG